MELISQLAEAQKAQEVQIKELREKLLKYQNDLREAEEGKIQAEQELTKCHENYLEKEIQLLGEVSKLNEEKTTTMNELEEAKKHWALIEEELERSSTDILGQMRNLEDRNVSLEEELCSVRKNLEEATASKDFLQCQIDGLTTQIALKDEELLGLRKTSEAAAGALHNAKVQILKERNVNDLLLNEVKHCRRDNETVKAQIGVINKQKDKLLVHIAELTSALKKTSIQTEIQDVKSYLYTLLQENSNLALKMDSVKKLIKAEAASVSTQTEMTHDDMHQYEKLDRDAALMVMRLREEMVNLKNDLVVTKQENDTLKGFIKDVKREREMKEESARVEKLETAMKSLTDMVRQEMTPSSEEVIINALQEVKKDLDTLKSRSGSCLKKTRFRIEKDVPVKLPSFKY